ncbi:MAG: hypothetical protein JWO71_4072 [Candidatus Acidoferrum typicum]|nr:hypothetical protein [Candidatus Acidoferrum typicum]
MQSKFVQQQTSETAKWRRLVNCSGYWKALIILFLLTLPFLHGEVDGDGIGYYAHLRSPLIDHNFAYATDWKDPHDVDRLAYATDWKDPQEVDRTLVKHVWENPVRRPGHLPNYFTVGPAILWSPFVVSTHIVVVALSHLGVHVVPDGKSRPYMGAMAMATALYGFAGLCISFSISRQFVAERWAFWATVGVWLGTSLPVYMYLHTSWSHAFSAFTTSLFLWYWLRTRESRTGWQWLILGLLAGLMIEVYYLNVVFLLAPLWEAACAYLELWRDHADGLNRIGKILRLHLAGILGALVALLPTFIIKQVVFGSPFTPGPYSLRLWNWSAPVFWKVLFSATHGLLVFTPIVLLAFLGLFYLYGFNRTVGAISLSVVLAFYALIAFYPGWSSVFGFGNRYFISLTPLFVLGLACALAFAERFWRDHRRASLRLVPLILIFVIWNLGLIYQWRTHLMPTRSAVYWDEVIYVQFHDVPMQALHDLIARFAPQSN